MDIEEVASVVREVGRAEVLPRFRTLADGDVAEKSPGDFVTIADRECERVLAERLRAIRDVPVVGEEAATADPSLLDLVASAPAAWIIDPIDGTSNFVAGDPDFVVMVALVEAGSPTAAWVWHPVTDSMLSTSRGHGTTRNGLPISRQPLGAGAEPTGVLKRKYVPEPGRARLGEFPVAIGRPVGAAGSAGIEYAQLIDGEIDFLFYWRTLPWDHAPCSLLAQEAGLRVSRLDGTTYEPGDGAHGLLSAAPEIWTDVAGEINRAIG